MISVEEENKMLCNDLKTVNITINSIYDLVNRKDDYPHAIPMLIAWLEKVQTDKIREGIVRSLTLRTAKEEISRALLKSFWEYGNSPLYNESTGWAYGNALSITASKNHLMDIIKLAKNHKLGSAREMLISCLGRIGKKRVDLVLPLLIDLMHDEEVMRHAIGSLGNLGEAEALSEITPFLEHSNKYIARVAKKSIDKIERKMKKTMAGKS